MELKITILSEIIQTQTTKCCIFSLIFAFILVFNLQISSFKLEYLWLSENKKELMNEYFKEARIVGHR